MTLELLLRVKDITNYDNILKIESVKSKEEKEAEDNDGITQKHCCCFVKSFTIADDVEEVLNLKTLIKSVFRKNSTRPQTRTISIK